MLAVASTRIVSTGLPAGGVTRSTHVGFSRTIRTSSSATPIIPTVPHQRARDITPGLRNAYHTSSVAAATASARHSDEGIRGSNVGQVIRSRPKHLEHADFHDHASRASHQCPSPRPVLLILAS